jgi:hypothetical protein
MITVIIFFLHFKIFRCSWWGCFHVKRRRQVQESTLRRIYCQLPRKPTANIILQWSFWRRITICCSSCSWWIGGHSWYKRRPQRGGYPAFSWWIDLQVPWCPPQGTNHLRNSTSFRYVIFLMLSIDETPLINFIDRSMQYRWFECTVWVVSPGSVTGYNVDKCSTLAMSKGNATISSHLTKHGTPFRGLEGGESEC